MIEERGEMEGGGDVRKGERGLTFCPDENSAS